jgi:hypothetical protein
MKCVNEHVQFVDFSPDGLASSKDWGNRIGQVWDPTPADSKPRSTPPAPLGVAALEERTTEPSK